MEDSPMNLPPETWYAIASVALTLLVSAAHSRGYRLPLLEVLLDIVHGSPTPTPAPAATAMPTLQHLLDELRKRLPLPEERK
jgi:hypothetical protein